MAEQELAATLTFWEMGQVVNAAVGTQEQEAGAVPRLALVKEHAAENSAAKTKSEPSAVIWTSSKTHEVAQAKSLAAFVAKTVVPRFKVKSPLPGAKAKLTVTSAVK